MAGNAYGAFDGGAAGFGIEMMLSELQVFKIVILGRPSTACAAPSFAAFAAVGNPRISGGGLGLHRSIVGGGSATLRRTWC